MVQQLNPRTLQDLVSLGVLGDSMLGNPLALVHSTQGLDAATLGLLPNTGKDITALLQSALNAARVASLPLYVRPGKYVYSAAITTAGGGLVCPSGIAWFDAQDAGYNNHVIDFSSSPSGTYQNGIEVRNIRFSCSTRPDSGLSNDAPEAAHFIRITKAYRVRIQGCRFEHNYGGAVLLRDVQGGWIDSCVAVDIWKDAFHATDDSFMIFRTNNEVYGGGDDAFAAVGYTAKGVKPRQVYDINNRVYGVRRARGFAYVGCDDFVNIGCYVQGRIPSYIPQLVGATGERYNTSCALYIAAESGGGATYGCTNGRVRGFECDGIASGIWGAGASGGTPGALTSTLQAIFVTASNGSGNPLKNIDIEATVRNVASRAVFANGNGNMSNLKLDIILENNKDPYGLTSLAYTPNTAQWNGVEVQNTRDVRVKFAANDCGRGAVYIDPNCSGELDVDLSVGLINQTGSGAQSAINIPANAGLRSIDLTLNFEQAPTAALPGLLDRVINNPNIGVTRSTRIAGVDHSPAAGNILAGYPSRALTLNTSTANTVMNTTGRDLLFFCRGGTVTAVARANVRGRSAATGTTGTTFTVLGDVTDIYAASAVVTFFDSKGVSINTSTVSSSTYASASNTTTVTVASVPATFVTGMQAAVVNTMRTIPGRTNGYFDLGPEMAIQVTNSAAPTAQFVEPSF